MGKPYTLPKIFDPNFGRKGIQPLGDVVVDRNNKFGRALEFGLIFNKRQPFDLTGKYSIEYEREFEYLPVKENVVIDITDIDLETWIKVTPNVVLSENDAWTTVQRVLLNGGNLEGMICGLYAEGTSNYFWYRRNHSIRFANGAGGVISSNNAPFNGDYAELSTYAVNTTGSGSAASNVRLFADGDFIEQLTGETTDLEFDTITQGRSAQFATYQFQGQAEYFYWFKETLTDAEIAEITADPYQVVKPRIAPFYSVPAGVTTRNITAAQTEAGDTQAAALQLIGEITASQGEAGDTQAAALQLIGEITASLAEAGDTQAASLEVLATPANITASQAEAGDTQAATLEGLIQITASQAEAGDTQAASLEGLIQITASLAEAGDTQAAALQLIGEITASLAEAGDTQAASIQADTGTITISSAQAEAGDTQAATLESIIEIAAAHTEAGDVATVNLEVLGQLTASQAEAGDTQAAGLNAFDFAAIGVIHYVRLDSRVTVVSEDPRTLHIRQRP
jgi:hypothetical protein